MTRSISRVILVLVLSLLHELVLAQDETVKDFFSFYFNEYQYGIPDATRISSLSKLITPELRQLLLDANSAEKCHAQRVHDTEPPLLEGDLFTSLFEGATDGKIAAVRVNGSTAEVDVEWIYDVEGEQTLVWQDRFYLASRKGVWLIDDIEHLGKWEFAYHGKISELLRDIAGQCRSGAD